MFRTILFFVATVLYMIVVFPSWPIAGFLKLIKKEDACNKMMFGIVKFACKVALVLIGVHIDEVKGKENITDEAALYITNHRSIFDIIILYTFMKFPTGFVAKKEMKKVPVFSVWMWWVKCLFLDREDIRQGLETINKGAEQLKSGINMSIFPEGTRNKDNSKTTLLPFHGGSFKMAVKSGAPIVPVAIYNSANCFEADFPKMHKTHVKVTFGEPIYVQNLDKKEQRFLGQYVQDKVQLMLNEFEQ